MLQLSPATKDLDDVLTFIQNDDFLNPHVLDVHAQDGTLVVLIDTALPAAFVQALVQKQWPGPVEAWCATDMIAGGG